MTVLGEIALKPGEGQDERSPWFSPQARARSVHALLDHTTQLSIHYWWLREDDGVLGVADRFESRLQRVGHRRGAAEKDHGVGTGRRQMPA
jgi:hypothetical protein